MIVRKVLAVAIILLFIGVSVIPSTGTVVEKKSTMLTSYDGDTLYVGGGGPGNYTRIQDAIDNAIDGDTVFVFSGIYFENLLVDKSIDLIGESKDNTFIWSVKPDNGCTVTITADSIVLRGFSIFNSSCSQPGINILGSGDGVIIDCNLHLNYGGISVQNSNNIIIKNCYLTDHGMFFHNTHNSQVLNCSFRDLKGEGIYLHESTYNLIMNCSFSHANGVYLDFSSSNNSIKHCLFMGSRHGIRIDKSSYNLVRKCDFYSCDLSGIYITGSSNMNLIQFNNLLSNRNKGIEIRFSNENEIYGNVIDKYIFSGSHTIGIDLQNAFNNTIEANTISNNTEKGILLTDSNNNSIINNNFKDNEFDAFFKNSYHNIWKHNYWNRPRFLPYPIFGKRTVGIISIPWINFDWRPARKPYDIPQIAI